MSGKLFECTECVDDEPFFAEYDSDGFLPDCPTCGCDYRVFEIEKEGE
ncbi:hypothetical protein [Salibacterium salarium]|nr:hypothetical protein [Salibacterium salarium]